MNRSLNPFNNHSVVDNRDFECNAKIWCLAVNPNTAYSLVYRLIFRFSIHMLFGKSDEWRHFMVSTVICNDESWVITDMTFDLEWMDRKIWKIVEICKNIFAFGYLSACHTCVTMWFKPLSRAREQKCRSSLFWTIFNRLAILLMR